MSFASLTTMETTHRNTIHLHDLKVHKLLSFFSIIIIIILFVSPFKVLSESTTFSFNTFDQNMLDKIKFEGDAYVVDQAIKLTKPFEYLDSNGSLGRATYSQPIHLWDKASGELANFKTSFSFAIRSQYNTSTGNGFAFFLANSGSRLQPSSGFAHLGLLGTVDVQSPFVAVEFDTAWSDWDPKDREDHIGIDVSSMRSANLTNWNNDVAHGGIIQASIHYDSHSKMLSVHVINDYYDDSSKTYERNLSYDLDYGVDFVSSLSEWVTVGFSASTSLDNFEDHMIYNWHFNSTLQPGENMANKTIAVQPNLGISASKRKNKAWLWALLVAIVALVLVSAVVGSVYFGYWRRKKRTQQSEGTRSASLTKDEFENETGPRSFSYEELAVATNNFDDDRVIGKGGFGMVYAGFLTIDGSCVAVKRIIAESELGLKAYASEVKTISRLRQRNLVQLLGWCRRKQELLIVYEFMPNKSLDFHLFNQTGLLTWERRYGVALGLASGLLYLHEECQQCVLHRDIKSSNVLLDSGFNAKLGDFGLARLVEHGQGSYTTKLMGTVGYVSPEYIRSSKATKESDVYSFGIVALEIATGKPVFAEVNDKTRCNNDKLKLTEWIWEQYQSGNIYGVADPLLNQEFVKEEMKRLIVVGLACAHPSPSGRLSIREAIEVLNFRVALPTLPLQPNIGSNYQANFAYSGSPTLGTSGVNTDQSSLSATSHST